MKFKATIEFEYYIADKDVESWYGTDSGDKAAEIDKKNFENDFASLMEMVPDDYTVKVEHLK